MPDYTYYTEKYLGEDIPPEAFDRLCRRAQTQLAYIRDLYAVEPRKGIAPQTAEDMALCAIADAMYEFEQEDEARGLAKMTVGSVSETYTAPPWLSPRTLELRRTHYIHEAGYYLQIGRWLPHA